MKKEDVWGWLYRPSFDFSREDIGKAIEELIVRRIVRAEDGNISLEVVDENEIRIAIREAAERKYKIAGRFAKYLAWIPGIRGIAVCNTLAWDVVAEDSDIDLFIITRPGAIWLARLFAAFPLRLFRARPGDKTRDPICLSFFITDEALDISELRILPDDPYLAYWTRSLVALADDGVFNDFTKSNDWAKNALPNSPSAIGAVERYFLCSTIFRLNTLLYGMLRSSGLLSLLEKSARKIQEKMFPKKIKELANKSTDVVVNDKTLKFHTDDARRNICEKWKLLRDTATPV